MSTDSVLRHVKMSGGRAYWADKAELDQRLLLQKIRNAAASAADFRKVDELVHLYRAIILKDMARSFLARLAKTFRSGSRETSKQKCP